jgi:lysophospholipase L1-like esterase
VVFGIIYLLAITCIFVVYYVGSMYPFLLYISVAMLIVIMYEAVRIVYYSRIAIKNGKLAEPLSQVVENPEYTILIVGDSTSYGTGASCKECSLVGRLAKDVAGASITNASKNAMSLSTLTQTLRSLSTNVYDVIIIHIGGIDTISLTPMRTIERYIGAVFSYATKMARKKVFLVSVNNAGLVPLFRFPLSLILFEEREREVLHKNPNRFFSSDKTHPNDEGYAIWYEKIRRIILPHLKKT